MNWLFEDPTTLIIVGIVVEIGLVVGLFQWGDRRIIYGLVGVPALVLLGALIERLVVTDREQIEALLERSVAALKADDAQTVLAAIDPATQKMRKDATGVMAGFRFVEVLITQQTITIGEPATPQTAEVDLFTRASVAPRGGQRFEQPFVGHFRLQLTKSGDRWLFTAYQERPLTGK